MICHLLVRESKIGDVPVGDLEHLPEYLSSSPLADRTVDDVAACRTQCERLFLQES